MTQYIDKSALVAEIERRIEGINPLSQRVGVVGCSNTIKHLRGILSFLNTIEVKDVDLDEQVIEKACDLMQHWILEHDYVDIMELEDYVKQKMKEL